MSALHRNPKIDFGRSRVASTAVLALNGAQSVDLGAVDRWARQHSGTTLNVAVDGGVRCWQARRRRVDLFVGDGDSAFPPAAGETILLPQDKPISDLGAALDRLLARRIRQFAIAGLWGERDVIVGAHMVFGTVVNERGRQTLPFIMSLPVSYGQYTAAKLI